MSEVRHLNFDKKFDEDSQRWVLIGKDVHGSDFGIGVGKTVEVAQKHLRDWVEEVLAVETKTWEDLTPGEASGEAIAFTASRLTLFERERV